MIESVNGKYVTVRGVKRRVLNLSSFDFLGLGQSQALKDVSKTVLEKYGCGSCGPRGFYGTIDLHLQFENEIAVFMRTAVRIIFASLLHRYQHLFRIN